MIDDNSIVNNKKLTVYLIFDKDGKETITAKYLIRRGMNKPYKINDRNESR